MRAGNSDDGAGRLTNRVVNGQTRTFTYDFTGRMTSLTDIDGSTFAYEFDGEGNRLSQLLNDCLSKRFVYDGADVLLELNPTNGVAYAWVNGPGIDQPIERLLFIDGTPRARRVFHADALGSVAALTDSGGAVIQTYAYAAFGSIRSSCGIDLNRVTYTGREQLGDSVGLMYYRHRIYTPVFGRFSSADPLGFVDVPNLFAYVRLSPLNWIDPFGLRDVWTVTGDARNQGNLAGCTPGAPVCHEFLSYPKDRPVTRDDLMWPQNLQCDDPAARHIPVEDIILNTAFSEWVPVKLSGKVVMVGVEYLVGTGIYCTKPNASWKQYRRKDNLIWVGCMLIWSVLSVL